MRLFIAIDLNNKDYFKQIQDQIPKDIKATFPKEFHLTLDFLGEKNNPEEIIALLSKIKFNPFTLKTTAIDFFPNKHNPRVIYLGLENNVHLLKLKSDIDKALNIKDNRFHPHVTLARIKQGNIKKLNITFQPKEFKITEFHLISSTLTKESPVYKILF